MALRFAAPSFDAPSDGFWAALARRKLCDGLSEEPIPLVGWLTPGADRPTLRLTADSLEGGHSEGAGAQPPCAATAAMPSHPSSTHTTARPSPLGPRLAALGPHAVPGLAVVYNTPERFASADLRAALAGGGAQVLRAFGAPRGWAAPRAWAPFVLLAWVDVRGHRATYVVGAPALVLHSAAGGLGDVLRPALCSAVRVPPPSPTPDDTREAVPFTVGLPTFAAPGCPLTASEVASIPAQARQAGYAGEPVLIATPVPLGRGGANAPRVDSGGDRAGGLVGGLRRLLGALAGVGNNSGRREALADGVAVRCTGALPPRAYRVSRLDEWERRHAWQPPPAHTRTALQGASGAAPHMAQSAAPLLTLTRATLPVAAPPSALDGAVFLVRDGLSEPGWAAGSSPAAGPATPPLRLGWPARNAITGLGLRYGLRHARLLVLRPVVGGGGRMGEGGKEGDDGDSAQPLPHAPGDSEAVLYLEVALGSPPALALCEGGVGAEPRPATGAGPGDSAAMAASSPAALPVARQGSFSGATFGGGSAGPDSPTTAAPPHGPPFGHNGAVAWWPPMGHDQRTGGAFHAGPWAIPPDGPALPAHPLPPSRARAPPTLRPAPATTGAGLHPSSPAPTRYLPLRDAAPTLPPPLAAVGWAPGGARTVDFPPPADAASRARDAATLNLSLMRWRLLPQLDLPRLGRTRVLLLGAGTLGCYLARALLGWGVGTVTLVDSGRVAPSNPARQPLFEWVDAAGEGGGGSGGGAGRPKAVAAAEALRRIHPGLDARGVQLAIPCPGGVQLGVPGEEAAAEAATVALRELIGAHDVVFLLTDSRASRWLPTALAAAAGVPAVTVALGFDSVLIVRHGVGGVGGEGRLGCYFCGGGPGAAGLGAPPSRGSAPLDQQCSVTRPGAAPLAAALAAELLVAALHHPAGLGAPHEEADEGEGGVEVGGEGAPRHGSPLGALPHTLRFLLPSLTTVVSGAPATPGCAACGPAVVGAVRDRGWGFLRGVLAVGGGEAALGAAEGVGEVGGGRGAVRGGGDAGAGAPAGVDAAAAQSGADGGVGEFELL